MRVMITGGTGFIGGAAARRLLARGDDVVLLARTLARAAPLEALGATVVQGDLQDTAALARAAASCDVALHSAGVPRPSTWRTFRAVHITGTRNVLDAARAAGVRRVVHLASQAVLFGGRDILDADDSFPYPTRHIDPYSATKAAGECLALAMSTNAFEVTSLRPGVVWGPGDTTILPILARLARSPLGIPMCGDGSNIEATTYIDHLTDAILAAFTAPAAPGHAYLITDPFRVSWKEFISRQVQAAGVRPRFMRTPRALAIPAAWLLDHAASALRLPVPLAYFGVRNAMTSRCFTGARARAELGYRPRIGLDEGLRRLRAWVEQIGGASSLIRAGATRMAPAPSPVPLTAA